MNLWGFHNFPKMGSYYDPFQSDVFPPKPLPYAACSKETFAWSDSLTISGSTATGLIGKVRYTYVSSSFPIFGLVRPVPVEWTPSVFNHSEFPASFNVPNGISIKNIEATQNRVSFSTPLQNPVFVFASIGNVSNPVAITFSDPVTVLFKKDTVQDSPTKITGTEGYAIVQFNGTFSSISFNYTQKEDWCNFVFGATVEAPC